MLTAFALIAAAGSPTIAAMLGITQWMLLPIIILAYVIAIRLINSRFAEVALANPKE
ncbi:hypothetical protein H8K35_03165 [Undibacterium sp. LX40W]|uniref:Uncharacterized protein n=1 Tax=Undibacterium nitidum TaxID=2762298 RepID=A0A923HMX2_9BURK|nr:MULTISPECIES: hypothetical protein [Undibacterium]MBC3880613.1 hypothetical protein [Undibacterium nitidum]MBC3890651.1 hypothetical protein [Undibacterium sp. LX40W]